MTAHAASVQRICSSACHFLSYRHSYMTLDEYGRNELLRKNRFTEPTRNKKAKLSQRWPRDAPYGCRENVRLSLSTPTLLFLKHFYGLLFRWILWMYRTNLKSVALPVPEIIAIEVLGGGCQPPVLGNRKPFGVGMVSFERVLMSFYRPSIVTFSLSLRVSEILSFLFSSTPIFPTPPKSELEGVALIVRAISLQDFQPISTNVTDGQTDGGHAIAIPRLHYSALCIAR